MYITDRGLEPRSVPLPTFSGLFRGPACNFKASAAQERVRKDRTSEQSETRGQGATRDRPGALPAPEGGSHKWLPSSAPPGTIHLASICRLRAAEHPVKCEASGHTAEEARQDLHTMSFQVHFPSGKTYDREVNKCIHLYIHGFFSCIQ